MKSVTRVLSTLVALVMVFGSSLAVANDETNAVGECLASDQVWLLVITEDGTVMANQCVGNPDNGEDALLAGGMVIRHSRNGVICSLNDWPSPCPRKFQGQFWNYWHQSRGQNYVFSEEGAATYRPEPGSIEAWCYNSASQEKCTPPTLRVVVDGVDETPADGEPLDVAPTTNEPATQNDTVLGIEGLWQPALLVVLAVGAVAGIVVVNRRRRDNTEF